MVDQAGQDPVEVQPAADVTGDPTESLSPMELVGDLVRSAGDADDRGDPVGEQAGHVDVPLRERAGGVPDDQQQAPRIDRARDQDGQLGPSVGEDRDRRIARVVALKDGRERRVARPVATGGHTQDTTEVPNVDGTSMSRSGAATSAAAWARGVSRSPFACQTATR